MKNLAIIPARSGSKGLKDKNIKNLAGKPLLAYAINATIDSGLYDTVHVSTDSEIYADIAEKKWCRCSIFEKCRDSNGYVVDLGCS